MFTDRRVNSLKSRRIRQHWKGSAPFKILSLDGGGIRGIYTAELLRLCEQTFCNGAPLARYFDMVSGTSTGGIIALGLGLQKSTTEIVDFYRHDGRKIFPPLPDWWLPRVCRVIRHARQPVLNHEELESALHKRFQGHLLGESICRLIIPAFMVPKTEIAVFKTDHHADFKRDHLAPMWKVARATSAAPTYLRGLEHEKTGQIFIDGGVWANNPVMIALVDALTAYDVSPEQVEIFSIGTGNTPFMLSKKTALRGLVSWREAIKAAIFLTTDNATAQAKLLLGPDRCLRIEPSSAEATIELDDYDKSFGILPALAATHFEQHRKDIERFFAVMANDREKHYSQP